MESGWREKRGASVERVAIGNCFRSWKSRVTSGMSKRRPADLTDQEPEETCFKKEFQLTPQNRRRTTMNPLDNNYTLNIISDEGNNSNDSDNGSHNNNSLINMEYEIAQTATLPPRYRAKYSSNAEAILKLASKKASIESKGIVGTEDILWALFAAPQEISRSKAVSQMAERGVSFEMLFGRVMLSDNARSAFQMAIQNAQERDHKVVGSEDLLIALFKHTKRDSRARNWLVASQHGLVVQKQVEGKVKQIEEVAKDKVRDQRIHVWPIFMWALQGTTTNTYKLFNTNQQQQRTQRRIKNSLYWS